MAPRMVLPERDVPGTRLRHWNRPMPMAVLKPMSYTRSMGFRLTYTAVGPSCPAKRRYFPCFRFSTRINATP